MPSLVQSVGHYAHLQPARPSMSPPRNIAALYFCYSWHRCGRHGVRPLPRSTRAVPLIRRRSGPCRALTMAWRRGGAAHIGRKALPLGRHSYMLCGEMDRGPHRHRRLGEDRLPGGSAGRNRPADYLGESGCRDFINFLRRLLEHGG